MGTIWTWYESGGSLGEPQDVQTGWSMPFSTVISAPESLQRVIWNVTDVATGQWDAGSGTPKPVSVGLLQVEGYTDDGTTVKAFASQWSALQLQSIGFSTGTHTYTYATGVIVGLTGGDAQVRRAAPPPPASGLILALNAVFVPTPYNDSSFYYMSHAARSSIQWLTSQPGP